MHDWHRLAADENVQPCEATPSLLQTIVFPSPSNVDKFSLYVRSLVGGAAIDNGAGLIIGASVVVDFATFFNAFSHRKWRDLTGLQTLAIRLSGRGRVMLDISLYTKTGLAHGILHKGVDLREAGTTVPIPDFATLPGELLGFRIEGASTEVILTSAAWVTSDAKRRDVQMAAVITTFGREAAVREAMTSFSSCTCVHPSTGSLELLVIDNGQTLPVSSEPRVTIVPNANLGGAGGFARGLVEAVDAGRFTHVLFMDDDAACEPESVWRTMTLLAYMRDPDMAVAGAMLLSQRPCIQHEKGGIFDRIGLTGTTWRSNKPGADLSLLIAICDNEEDDQVNYGAWWFFGFPLQAVKVMPFPFFVRGDDVDFSLSNGFRIATLNGIATWSDNFGTKLDAATEYLAYRGWMAVALIHGSEKAAFLALWNGLRVARTMAYRFDYLAMNAVVDGIEDAMRGPAVFRATPAPIQKLKALRAARKKPLFTIEHLATLKAQAPDTEGIRRRSKRTFGGHLRARKVGPVCVHSFLACDFHKAGLVDADKAAFGTGPDLRVLDRDRSRFFRGKWRMNKVFWRNRFQIAAAQERYRVEGPALRTREFWVPLFARAFGPSHPAQEAAGSKAGGSKEAATAPRVT